MVTTYNRIFLFIIFLKLDRYTKIRWVTFLFLNLYIMTNDTIYYVQKSIRIAEHGLVFI